MRLRQLDSTWVVFEGGERYLIILLQSCIQVEVMVMDPVQKFMAEVLKKSWTY